MDAATVRQESLDGLAKVLSSPVALFAMRPEEKRLLQAWQTVIDAMPVGQPINYEDIATAHDVQAKMQSGPRATLQTALLTQDGLQKLIDSAFASLEASIVSWRWGFLGDVFRNAMVGIQALVDANMGAIYAAAVQLGDLTAAGLVAVIVSLVPAFAPWAPLLTQILDGLIAAQTVRP